MSTTAALAGQAPGAAGGAPLVFGADVVIDDALVDATGGVVEARPQTRYHLSVRRVGGQLETEVVYPPARLFPRGPLADPRSGLRLVFDSAFKAPRVYDAEGRLLSLPAGAMPLAPEPSPGQSGAGPVLADDDARSRKDRLVRELGPAVGMLNGRDRYVVHDDGLVTETLVDPAAMLPVEVNVVRDGRLEQRNFIAYARLVGRRWYVATTRSEAAVPGNAHRRFVTTRTYLNVVAEEEPRP
jgi:hypothetical protein